MTENFQTNLLLKIKKSIQLYNKQITKTMGGYIPSEIIGSELPLHKLEITKQEYSFLNLSHENNIKIYDLIQIEKHPRSLMWYGFSIENDKIYLNLSATI